MNSQTAQMPSAAIQTGTDEVWKPRTPQVAQKIVDYLDKRMAKLKEKKATNPSFMHCDAPDSPHALRQRLKRFRLPDGAHVKLHRDELEVLTSEADRLGEGGQGSVYKGRMKRRSIRKKDKETLVAVKTIQVVAVGMDETIWCEGKAKAAYAELMALLSLSHLNENGPVRLLGARVVSETIPAGEVTSLRIVLELANKSLKKIIEEGTYTDGEALDMAIEITRRVKDLHESGMIHFDIKPDNILQCKDGALKMTDFGLACCMEDTEARCECTGTPSHLPPEMMRRGLARGPRRTHCQKADIFSLNVCLCELFLRSVADDNTGNRPCKISKAVREAIKNTDAPEAAATLYKDTLYSILETRPGQTGVPKDLLDILVQGLSLEPSDRQTAQQLLDQLLTVRDARQQAQEPAKQCGAPIWTQTPSVKDILAPAETVTMAVTETQTQAVTKTVTVTQTPSETETGSEATTTQTITDPLAVGVALIAMEKAGAVNKQGVQADDGDKVSTHKNTLGWKIGAMWDNLTSSLKRTASGHSADMPALTSDKPMTKDVDVTSDNTTKTESKRKGFLKGVKSVFTGCVTSQVLF